MRASSPGLLSHLAVNTPAVTTPARVGLPTLATWGTAAGVLALLLLLGVLLPQADRKRLRTAFTLMLTWSVTTVLWCTPFLSEGLRDTCELISMVALALAAARTGWLFVVGWGLKNGSVLGMSQLARDLVQAVIFLMTAIAAARAAGADAQSLATTGGLVTAGLTFSLQQTLGDLVAGILLQAQAPFRVGDWIAYDDNPRRIGKVREINWRATKVVTIEHLEVTVPNSVLAKASIVNFSEPSPVARRSFNFVVGYQHPPRKVQRIALAALRGMHGVLELPPPSCLMSDVLDSGVQYWLRYFIEDQEIRDKVDSEARVRLWYAFRRAGIEFVFPRTEVALVDVDGERASVQTEARDRRGELFDRIDFLAPLSPEQRARLAGEACTELFTAGETIVQEGDRTTELYIVAEGQLAVFAGGKKSELARLRAGDIFGEMALLTGEPRSATVRAVDDCVVYVVSKAALHSVLAEHKGLLEQISHVVAERQGDIARKRGEADATGAKQALRESSLLERMKQFFTGE